MEERRAETDRRMEADRAEFEGRMEADRAEFERRMEERRAETDRFLKSIGKQVGELGNKFGGFTEGMALPAMQKLLRRRFKMDLILPRACAHKNGRMIELDLLGLLNKEGGDAYLVEIKSRFQEEDLQQILDSLREAPSFFSLLKGKRLYGIVAAVDIPKNMQRRVLKAGLYLALVHDDTFKLAVPRGFKPKAFHSGR
jgi:hypothetical protein